jgi:hypothetical protein
VYVCARECACVACVCMHGFKHVIKHDTCMHTVLMLKGEVKFPKVHPRASTRETWPAAPLHCKSHNVFRVDLIAIENHLYSLCCCCPPRAIPQK